MMTTAPSRRCAGRCRLTPVHRAVPLAQKIRFRLRVWTMIRHASHPGAVTAASLGVHGAAPGSCLITAAGISLPLTTGGPGAASHAINLASIAPPANKDPHAAAGTEKHSAGHLILTYGETCSAHAGIALKVHLLRHYWDLRQILAAWPKGIRGTTDFRGCPPGP